MASKTLADSSVQIVFLIDENSTKFSSEIQVNEIANCFRLSVLRILTYFNEKQKLHHGNIRWGVKYYNSKSLVQRYLRHEFKDFCVSSFEEFENDVCYRLEEFFRKSESERERETRKEGNNEELERSSSKITAGKCLTCALTDLIHDFQWENTDIISPVRKTRNSKSQSVTHPQRTRNIVFLLSPCPLLYRELDEFCGSEIRDVDSLRSVLMSTALLREFNNYGITLHWLDSTSYWNRTNQESCIEVVKDFLHILNGRLIPLSSLVDNYLSSTKSPSALLVPFTSIMDSYIEGKLSGNNPEIPAISKDDDSSHNRLLKGYLYSPGSNMVHCEVRLSPMFASSSDKKANTSATSEPLCHEVTLSCNSISRTVTLLDKVGTERDKKEHAHSPNLVWIRGIVRREKVCPTWLHETLAYTCVGMATSHVTDKEGDPLTGDVSTWYQNLLLSLARENLLLVVEMVEPDSSLMVTAVLQPLTSICGVLSIVNNAMLVTLEKLRAWSGQRCTQGEGARATEKACELLSTRGKAERVELTHQEATSLVFETSVTGTACFAPQELDVWNLGLSCTQEAPDTLHSFTETRSEDARNIEESDESDLMRQLRELYSSENILLPKQIPSQKTATKKQNKRTAQNSTQIQSSSDVTISAPKNSVIAGEEQKQNEELIISLNQGKQDCVTYLMDLYQRAVDGGIELTNYIDQTMTVVKWKVKQEASEKCSVQSLVADHLLLDSTAIRAHCEEAQHSKDKKTKIYQVQVLLRMELALLVEEPETDSSLINEVVVMLRAISLAKDPGFLRDFMHEVVLKRYATQISKFLCEVYWGLMQNPPRILLSPSQISDEESPLKRCNSSSISRPESDQPSSTGGRPITRHRSVADVGGKRREIVIPGRTKPKTSKHKKLERPRPSSARNNRIEKGKTRKTPVKKVRRNLFSDDEDTGEEGEGTGTKVKLKVPGVFAKEHKPKHKFSRRHSVAACSGNVVQETPARKQLSHALWHKQHRARKRTSTVTDLNVVHESPLKDIQAAENLPRRSPRRHVSSFQRSTAFYGSTAASCPLKRTRSFTASTSSGSPVKRLKLESAESEESSRSPSKLQTVEGSVSLSPIRFTPDGKRKKFSLQALLSRPLEPQSPQRKTKRTSPKHGRVVGVRSSPRLLKRRSFSCIGFSNAAPLGGSTSWSTTSDNTSSTRNSDKNTAVTSPKNIGPTSEVDHPNIHPSGSVTPSRKLRKALLQSPRRSSPRLKRTLELTTSSVDEIRADPGNSPARAASVAAISFTPPKASGIGAHNARVTPKRGLIQSPRRPPGDRLKHEVDSDEEVTFRAASNEPAAIPVESAKKLVAPSPKLQVKLQAIDSSLSDVNLMFDEDVASGVGPPHHHAVNDIVSKILKSGGFNPEEKEDSKLSPGKKYISKMDSKSSFSRSHSSDFVVLLSPVKRLSGNECDVTMETSGEVYLETKEANRTVRTPERVTQPVGVNRTCCRSPRQIKSPSTHRVTRAASREFPAPMIEDLRIELQDVRGECDDKAEKREFKGKDIVSVTVVDKEDDFVDKAERVGDPVPGRPSSTTGVATPSLGDVHEEREDASEPPPVGTRKPPRKPSQSVHAQSGSQRLLVPKPSLCTPPSKKQKKSRSLAGSPADKKSSPINQMLKQRKRNRSDPVKTLSNKDHVKTVFGPNPLKRPSPPKRSRKSQSTRKKAKTKGKALAIPPPDILDECSQSSEDMIDDWLTDIDIHHQSLNTDDSEGGATTPSSGDSKKRLKSLVFGGTSARKKGTARKTPKSSLDSSFNEDNDDEVFRSPSDYAQTRKNRLNSATPISAQSLKILQESPIIFNKEMFRPSPSSLSKSLDEYTSPKDQKPKGERLTRRKHSEAFGELSSEGEHESSLNESSESASGIDSVERFPRSRKRIKLMSN